MSSKTYIEHLMKKLDAVLLKIEGPWNRWSLLLSLALLLLIGGWLRLRMIEGIGVQGADPFWYWKTAKNWFDGNPEIARHYRPVAHLVYSASFFLFGVKDHSLRLMNSMLDIANIVLLFWCATIVLKSRFCQILCAAVIALSMAYIGVARTELVHTMSTTAILFTFVAFLLYFRKSNAPSSSNLILLALAGFGNSVAGHIHPELFTFGAVFCLAILHKNRGSEKLLSVKTILRSKVHLLVFIASYLVLFLAFAIYFGPTEILSNIRSGVDAQASRGPSGAWEHLVHFYKGATFYITGLAGPWTTLLFYLAILYAFFWKRNSSPTQEQKLCAYLSLFHLFVLTVTIAWGHLPRLFLPVLPIAIVFLFSQVQHMVQNQAVRLRVFAPLAVALYLINPMELEAYVSEEPRESVYLEMSKQVKPTETEKILITPLIFYRYYKGFKFELYFHENAIYLFEHRYDDIPGTNPVEKLEEIFKRSQARYLFVGTSMIDRRLIEKERFATELMNIYGGDVDDYALEKEMRWIEAFIESRDGKEIYASDRGKIFDLGGTL